MQAVEHQQPLPLAPPPPWLPHLPKAKPVQGASSTTSSHKASSSSSSRCAGYALSSLAVSTAAAAVLAVAAGYLVAQQTVA